MAVSEVATEARPEADQPSTRSRLALWVFVAYLVVAAPLILFHLGDYHWFFGDEWSFLAERDGADLDDLFRSHGEHWVTLPVITYRLLFNLVGLDSYLPYQAVVVTGHLVSAGLLRVVMRRAEVGPWIATVVASVFVLLGPGEENIVWAFQIAFVFAFMFGLVHLILSDHDGPVDRRDWFALAAGLAGLMSSGVSLVMVAVVGLAVLLRRGWQLALFHTAPLAAAYATWYLLTDPGGIDNPFGRSATAGELVRFVWSGVPAGLETVGGTPLIGYVMAAMLVVGVGLVLTTDPGWRRIGPSAALFAGIGMFLVGTGYTRWFVTETADAQSRYLYTLAALGLPLFAVAADMVVRRWRPMLPVVLAPFAVALVLNLDGFGDRDPWNSAYHQAVEDTFLSMAHSDLAREVPAYVRPNTWFTVGWLRDAADDGDVPRPPPGAEARAGDITLRLAAAHLDVDVGRDCPPLEPGTVIDTEAGDVIGFGFDGPPAPGTAFFLQNTLVLELIGDDGTSMGTTAFPQSLGSTVELTISGLRFEPRAAAPGQGLLLCR